MCIAKFKTVHCGSGLFGSGLFGTVDCAGVLLSRAISLFETPTGEGVHTSSLEVVLGGQRSTAVRDLEEINTGTTETRRCLWGDFVFFTC